MKPAAKNPSSKLFKKASFSKLQLILFAIIFASIGGYAIYRSFAATGGALTPTVYIAQSSSGSANGSSCSNPISASSSNSRSYLPGDVIGICSDLTTELQFSNNDSGTSASPVTLEPAPGHTVTIEGVYLGASGDVSLLSPDYFTVDGNHSLTSSFLWVMYRGFSGDPQPSHITIKNSHITDMSESGYGLMVFQDVSYLTVSGNEIGPNCCDSDQMIIALRNYGDPNPDHVSITDNYFHDAYDTCTEVPDYIGACSGMGFGDPGGEARHHVDAIQPYGCDTCNFERNTIYLLGNERQSVFLYPSNGGTFNNILFQNNLLTGTTDNTLSFVGTVNGTPQFSGYLKILYNTILGNVVIGSGLFNPGMPVTVAGNIINGQSGNQSGGGCSGITYSNNSAVSVTWSKNLQHTTTGCGTDLSGVGTFVQGDFPGVGTCNNSNGSGCHTATGVPSLHLSGSQVALNGGESTYCPAIDIDGDTRPQGSACDIGADEVGAGNPTPIPGDLNSDGHVTITDLSILLSNYATTNTTADINHDGTVNILDLSILLSHYGS